MLFALFYVVAIVILVLHFTGFLARHNRKGRSFVNLSKLKPARQ